ncbi:hypothetical protein Emag_004908 [Eimeria magna]
MLARGATPARLRSSLRLTPSRVCSVETSASAPQYSEDWPTKCLGGVSVDGRSSFCRLVLNRGRDRQMSRGSCAVQLSKSSRASSLCTLPTATHLEQRWARKFHLPQSRLWACGGAAVATARSAVTKSSGTAIGGPGVPGSELCEIRHASPPALFPSDPRAFGLNYGPVKEKARSPQALVEYLDNYIVGQERAKTAVAVALRQRWRRRQLKVLVGAALGCVRPAVSPDEKRLVSDPEMRADITPKNILLIGPTGIGKTEIARRLAQHLDAPFLKVEATKYTEVGFHGRDVDQIIKDLMEVAVKQKKTILEQQLRSVAEEKAEAKILEALAGKMPADEYGMWLRHLRRGSLDSRRIQIDLPTHSSPQGDLRMAEKRYVTIKEALSRLTQAELDSMITKDMVVQQAMESVEQEGIVFIDEIDKICSRTGVAGYHGPDASDEGVQRDLLPLLEGSTVSTRYGEIKTDYILFIASGAFHAVRPSDMLAELQGRLPVRVALSPLTENDFRLILTKTKHNLIEQHKALLATEGVILDFSEDAIAEVAKGERPCPMNSC